MSVVNDILRNLNERPGQSLHAQPFPYASYHAEKSQLGFWMLMGLLVVVTSISTILVIKIWQSDNLQKTHLALPEDVFLAPTLRQDSESKPITKEKVAAEDVQPSSLPHKPQSLDPASDSETHHIAKKTPQTVHLEQAVSAIKKGEDAKAKDHIEQSPQYVRDELTLHRMLKSEPENVYAHIRKNFSDFEKHPVLVAFSAQGEQRSGRHQSALKQYQTLIRLQPRQAKWRAGMAISLEAVGDQDSAKRMYQLALNMPNLPSSLAQFSRERLKLLSN